MGACIDIHAHVGHGAHKSLDPNALLVQMDKHGVERCVICPVEEYITVRNREGNDYLAALVGEHPDRFLGLAVSNPWYGPESVDELKRAMGLGLRGLKIHSARQGFLLCDPILDPLLAVAEEAGGIVYAHTGTMDYALPFQLLELAERFPNIPFIMGHMGFSDFWYDVIPVMQRAANIYAETSHMIPDVIQNVIGTVGASRVLFGSDVPESTYDVEKGKFDLMDLMKDQVEAIMYTNAVKLLGAMR